MWSPEQYERFRVERRQPFVDLLALVERRPRMRVVDLGCGPGELTRELHETLKAAMTVGVDSSAAMLEKAQSTESLQFVHSTIEEFVPAQPPDLIFSNAALHWVPDHVELFARLTSLLAPHGQLAVQMPANDEHASHRIAAELAQEMNITSRPDPLLRVEQYAELLHRLGYADPHVRLQVYGHVLPSADDVVEWVRGALLTYYEELLGDGFGVFLDEYRRRVRSVLGDARPYFYTYKRILLHATLK
jgi:trans-aconitate 2-methyltransferase